MNESPIMESRAVGQGFVTPVDGLVSSESRHAAVEVECLRVVADKVEVVTGLPCELCHRDAAFLSVGLVGLEITASETPSVGFALEH